MFRRLVGSALLYSLAAGCAAYTGSARDVTPNVWKHERGWIAVDDVPLLRQRAELDCGPTALAMVVGYWRPGSAQEIAAKTDQRYSAGELRDRARALGLAAEVVSGDLRDIKFELEQGRPVIVGVAKPTAEGAVSHYEVVVGVHPDTKRIASLDPAAGWRQNSYEGFLKEWIPAGRLLLVVAGERRAPATAPAPVANRPAASPGS
jgi:ABC-type bacteriocin/lantibiotic exporter with double-glycine peptidase domain